MKQVLVKVDWLHPAQGGRKELPSGDSFQTVGKFPHQTMQEWLSDAWTVKIDWLDRDNSASWYGLASFPAPNSPEDWLTAGGSFELFEGPRSIGAVSVLSTAKAIQNLRLIAA